jgi:hypothetical protein
VRKLVKLEAVQFMLNNHTVSILQFKELNPRRRVYVEIPKPVRVKLKHNFSDTREGFGIST